MIDHADELSVPQESVLRERAREAIRSDRLPSRWSATVSITFAAWDFARQRAQVASTVK